MMCDRCGENKATVHKIQMGSDDEVTHLQLCGDCADDNDSEASQEPMDSVSKILSSLEGSSSEDSTVCSNCGMTLQEFRNIGRVGCPDCYSAFEDHIEKIIHRVHGADQHVESGQEETGLEKVSDRQKKQILEKRLQERVEEENYEEAAELRDRIEELEEQLNNEPG